MKKYNLIVFLFFVNFVSFALENDSTSIIKNSSYVIFEGDTGIIGGVPSSSKYATFYTYDGQKLKEEEYSIGAFSAVTNKLDPKAPKPQPVVYKIQYWSAISLGWGLTKGMPGNFIVFYDKNQNKIESYRYDKEKDEITIFSETNPATICYLSQILSGNNNNFPLDLSKVREEKVEDDVQSIKKSKSCLIQ